MEERQPLPWSQKEIQYFIDKREERELAQYNDWMNAQGFHGVRTDKDAMTKSALKKK